MEKGWSKPSWKTLVRNTIKRSFYETISIDKISIFAPKSTDQAWIWTDGLCGCLNIAIWPKIPRYWRNSNVQWIEKICQDDEGNKKARNQSCKFTSSIYSWKRGFIRQEILSSNLWWRNTRFRRYWLEALCTSSKKIMDMWTFQRHRANEHFRCWKWDCWFGHIWFKSKI